MTERPEAVIHKGSSFTAIGAKLKVGDRAPDFKLSDNNFGQVTMAEYAGKVRLISVVPSLDTGICDAQTRRFNEEAAALGDDVGS